MIHDEQLSYIEFWVLEELTEATGATAIARALPGENHHNIQSWRQRNRIRSDKFPRLAKALGISLEEFKMRCRALLTRGKPASRDAHNRDAFVSVTLGSPAKEIFSGMATRLARMVAACENIDQVFALSDSFSDWASTFAMSRAPATTTRRGKKS